MSKIEKSSKSDRTAEFVPPATVPSRLPVPTSAPGLPMMSRERSGTPFDATLEEHHGIRHDVQELTDHLGRYRVGMEAHAWRGWMTDFTERVSRLHARLLEHFAEEEGSGLYETLGEKLPGLVPRTRVVREEHTTIVKELAGILASIDVLQPTFPLQPNVIDRTREILYRIVCHERKESDLIARAYLEELGERS